MAKSVIGYKVIADNYLVSEFVATKEEGYALAPGAHLIDLIPIYSR